MLPGDGTVKRLSTSGFNKSVMTFDGLISACVWFLKMAREGRERMRWGARKARAGRVLVGLSFL